MQKWLKGINSQHLDNTADIGSDGMAGTSNPRAGFSRDVFGFSLGYFTGDYKPIGGTSAKAFAMSYQSPQALSTGNGLYNGNISYSTMALSKISSGALAGYSYGYDQLNRLVKMSQHTIESGASSWSNSNIIDDYKEEVAYDANGNILSFKRNGALQGSQQRAMDDLTYRYTPGTNRLDHVDDAVASGNYTVDIDDQDTLNYRYDAIGNLTKDVAEGIDNIEWTVYGKIKSIQKTAAGTTITYSYDASGNRISKKVVTAENNETTYYVRDVQGNTMGVYKKDNSGKFLWQEQHLYGSSRLGLYAWGKELPLTAPVVQGTTPMQDSLLLGSTTYELSNHLGNVLATISDKRKGIDLNGDGVIDYFEAEVTSAQDYYSGGMGMPGRTFTLPNSTEYRYGFNGQEKSDEIKGEGNSYTAQFWEYDPRIGRRWNRDPKPSVGISEYSAFANSPVWFSDPLGDTTINGQKYEAMNAAAATTLNEVVVGNVPKRGLPNNNNSGSSVQVPYPEINSIALDRNLSNYEKIKQLRVIGARPLDPSVQRHLDGALLKNILAGAILETLDKTFTMIDILNIGKSIGKGSEAPLEIPVIGGVPQMIVNDLVAETDQFILEDGIRRGYQGFARVLNSSTVGKRSGLTGVYVTKDVMLSVLKTGGLNLSVHNVSRPSSGVYPDDPNRGAQKFDYFVFFPKDSEGTIKNFGVLPIEN